MKEITDHIGHVLQTDELGNVPESVSIIKGWDEPILPGVVSN
jgi:hypothetical protein